MSKKYHQNVWTDVEDSLRDSGIIDAKIYNTGNRLFMILDVDPSFRFENKVILDSSNPRVREWEELMWNFQK